MSQADALFRTLSDAPPRSLQIVRRAFLEGLSTEQLASLYGITPEATLVLVDRALADTGLSESRTALVEHRTELIRRLDAAAIEWAKSPDRQRDERLRQLAIVVVLALTAFFYWREANKPLPPPHPRPVARP